MSKTLIDLRPVYVVGIGLHRYQRLSETTYVDLGLTAVRAALADAKIQWSEVEAAYTGTAFIGMAASRPMLRHLGATGIPYCRAVGPSATNTGWDARPWYIRSSSPRHHASRRRLSSVSPISSPRSSAHRQYA